MTYEDRALLDEVADFYHPDEGDPLETALSSRDAFFSDMSDAVARHLLPAILGYSSTKGVATDADTAILSIPSRDGTFAGTMRRNDIRQFLDLSIWHVPSGQGSIPEKVLDISASSTKRENGVSVRRRNMIEDWRSILDLSERMIPHVRPRPVERNALLAERLLEADGGLPGEHVRSALNTVVGRVVSAALDGMTDAVGTLNEVLDPNIPEKIGNGWSAIVRERGRNCVEFSKSGSGTFTMRIEPGRSSDGSRSCILNVLSDRPEEDIVHDTSTGRTVASEFVPSPVLLSLAEVCGRAIDAAGWLSYGKMEDEARAPGI